MDSQGRKTMPRSQKRAPAKSVQRVGKAAGESGTQQLPLLGGSVYLLWGEGTTRFKVGFTHGNVDNRAATIMAYSPVPLRILGARYGSPQDEKLLHYELRSYRVHGEWFSLPEPIVWSLLRWFGAV